MAADRHGRRQGQGAPVSLSDTLCAYRRPVLMPLFVSQLVMNVALGFDTFLAMRHGLAPSPNSPAPDPAAAASTSSSPFRGRLGCYYCNDVVAPQDVRPTFSLEAVEARGADLAHAPLPAFPLAHPPPPAQSRSATAPSTRCAPSRALVSPPSRAPPPSSSWSRSCSILSGASSSRPLAALGLH